MARLLSKDREGPVSVGASDDGGPDLSVVTKNMRVTGDIETKGAVRIEGTVTGSVKARSVEVTASGRIEGDLETTECGATGGLFVIGGSVRGAVRAVQLEVRQGGSVLGGVVADSATVGGLVQNGLLTNGRLVLTGTAVVEGDVQASRLALEEGGQVNGTVRIGDAAAPVTKSPGQEPKLAAARSA
jgi:cytoskeletal protein CcmA (bactofilin family)